MLIRRIVSVDGDDEPSLTVDCPRIRVEDYCERRRWKRGAVAIDQVNAGMLRYLSITDSGGEDLATKVILEGYRTGWNAGSR